MTTLKSLAQKAKHRLKSVGLNAPDATSTLSPDEIIKRCALSYLTLGNKEEDDNLYPKVKRLLDKNPDLSNPLGELIDYNFFNKLNPTEKEKYILSLSARYRKLRKKYFEDKNL